MDTTHDPRARLRGALTEDFDAALRTLRGDRALRDLKLALREFELDSAALRAIALRIKELQSSR